MPVRLPNSPVSRTTTPAVPPLDKQQLVYASSSLQQAPPGDTEEITVPQTVCSGCGLSEEELNKTGVFGCPRCYETFAVLLATAVEELHGVRVPPEFYKTPSPNRAITMPWPTRRGIRL